MYGYIKPYTPEMKVREQEYYRAVYCGLCRTMGKCTGQCSRFTLSYDFTFLALVRLALEGRSPEISPHRCVLHPLKKKPMAQPDDTLDFCAYASAILAFHKLEDDKKDERGIRRFKAKMFSPYIKKLRKMAKKHGFEALDTCLTQDLEDLSNMEASHIPSVDQPADLFGKAMSDLISHGLEGTSEKIAQNLGHHLGRWIYMADAIDDYEEDLAKGRYNPFVSLWHGEPLTDEKRESLTPVFMRELAAIEAALDLCEENGDEQKDLWGVIRNILYLGMPAVVKLILFKDKEHDIK